MFCIDLNDLFILVKFEFPFLFGMQLSIALFSLVSRSGFSLLFDTNFMSCFASLNAVMKITEQKKLLKLGGETKAPLSIRTF